MALREHELRRQLVGEMHLRRWPGVFAPACIHQILRIVPDEEREAESERLAEIGDPRSIQGNPGSRHISGRLECGIPFVWERHTEGSTITLFANADDSQESIAVAVDQIEQMPGAAIRATRIEVMETDKQAWELIERLQFSHADLVSCTIGPGVRFWSDFKIHEGGYGRVVVAANGCPPVTLSRTIQQLQELGNYRNLALMGLPPTRKQWAELDTVEGKLREFASHVSDPTYNDDALLEVVSGLQLSIATLTNAIGYRLDATSAYAQLVSERLVSLEPQPIPGFQSITDFTQRRLLPGVRTCEAHRKRLSHLSDRARDLTALLRARIETRIENQNARLLESMNSTGERQMRLQQLVEGLSIFALSYYGVGLLGYVLGGLELFGHLPSEAAIKAIAVPVFMLAIWLAMHTLKRRILGDDH